MQKYVQGYSLDTVEEHHSESNCRLGHNSTHSQGVTIANIGLMRQLADSTIFFNCIILLYPLNKHYRTISNKFS